MVGGAAGSCDLSYYIPYTQGIGGVSSSRYYGNIYYTPIVKKQYYNVLFSNISVGGAMISMSCPMVSEYAAPCSVAIVTDCCYGNS